MNRTQGSVRPGLGTGSPEAKDDPLKFYLQELDPCTLAR